MNLIGIIPHVLGGTIVIIGTHGRDIMFIMVIPIIGPPHLFMAAMHTIIVAGEITIPIMEGITGVAVMWIISGGTLTVEEHL